MSNQNVFEVAKLAALAADSKLGTNIVAYDVRGQNAVADVYMFVGATSHIHVRALEDAIREAIKLPEVQLLRTDGQRGHLWRVLDYGSVLIHIMEEKTREYYSVERLWEEGKKIPLLTPVTSTPKVVKKKSVVRAAKKTAKKVRPSVKKAKAKKTTKKKSKK